MNIAKAISIIILSITTTLFYGCTTPSLNGSVSEGIYYSQNPKFSVSIPGARDSFNIVDTEYGVYFHSKQLQYSYFVRWLGYTESSEFGKELSSRGREAALQSLANLYMTGGSLRHYPSARIHTSEYLPDFLGGSLFVIYTWEKKDCSIIDRTGLIITIGEKEAYYIGHDPSPAVDYVNDHQFGVIDKGDVDSLREEVIKMANGVKIDS